MLPLIFCVLILTACALFNKHSIGQTNANSIQLINCIVAIGFIPIWIYTLRKVPVSEWINKSTAPYVIIASVLSTVGFLLFLMALKTKSASVATSVLSTYPALTMLIGCALGMEKFNLPRALGIVLILCGIVTIKIFDN